MSDLNYCFREGSSLVLFDIYFKGKIKHIAWVIQIFLIKMEFYLLILYSRSSQPRNETATGPSG